MLVQLKVIRKIMEELMAEIREHNAVEPRSVEEVNERFDSRWDKAETVNDWAFEVFKNGELPWDIARLIKADCIDNDVNMETWMNINSVILNADILLKGTE